MIDTLRLKIAEFSIKDPSLLTIAPGKVQISDTGDEILLDSFYLFEAGGRTYYGSKAYWNSDLFQLTIVPMRFGDDAGQKSILILQFSIPLLDQPINYVSLPSEKEKGLVYKIIKDINNYGIQFDPKSAKISRIDTFDNCETEYPPYFYTFLWAGKKFGRLNEYTIENNYGWRNKQQEVIVYDKRSEVASKYPDFLNLVPDNVLRFECKYKKTRKVEKAYGFCSLHDLWSNYEVIKKDWKDRTGKLLSDAWDSDVSIEDSKKITDYYKCQYKRNFQQYILRDLGLYYISQNLDTNIIKMFIAGKTKNKRLAEKRFEIASQNAIARLTSAMDNDYGVTRKSLFDEINNFVNN